MSCYSRYKNLQKIKVLANRELTGMKIPKTYNHTIDEVKTFTRELTNILKEESCTFIV